MFETKNDNIDTYVGGLVESIKCQVVDASFPVANTNGHVSTKTQYKCPGEDLARILGTATISGKRGKHNVHPADVSEIERSCQMKDDVLEFSQ